MTCIIWSTDYKLVVVSDLHIAQLWYSAHTTKKGVKLLLYKNLHVGQMVNGMMVLGL